MRKAMRIILLAASISCIPILLWAADTKIKLDSSDGSSNLAIQDSGSTTISQIDSDGNIVAKGCLRVDSGGTECTTAENLIVDGNVGVGTSTPSAALELSGTNVAMILTNNSADTDYWISAKGDTGNDDDDSLQIGDGGIPGTNPFLTLTTNGSFGVGTTAPLAPLHISKDDSATTTVTNVLQLNHSSSGTPDVLFGTGLAFSGEDNTFDGKDMGRIYTQWLIAFDTLQSSRMIFETQILAAPVTSLVLVGDSVGIGTTSVGVNLDIRESSDGGDANIALRADRSDDEADIWILNSAASDNDLNIKNGGFVQTTEMTLQSNGIVRVGDAGTINIGDGNGDLYVEDELEVDGAAFILGNVGIGSTAPRALLELSSTTGVLNKLVMASGNVGIGSTAPESLLEIQGAEGVNAELDLDADDGDDAGDTWFIQSAAADNDLNFINNATTHFFIQSNGIVRVGDAGTMDFADGNGDLYVEDELEVDGVCDGNASCNQDVAEEFDSEKGIEAGDVVILDHDQFKTLKYTTIPFDSRVVGVVSTAPTIAMGSEDSRKFPVPLALTGVVPTKVTNENGPIKVGDNLTTSSTPGHGMKFSLKPVGEAVDFNQLKKIMEENGEREHSVFGTAMENCDQEKCTIYVLVK